VPILRLVAGGHLSHWRHGRPAAPRKEVPIGHPETRKASPGRCTGPTVGTGPPAADGAQPKCTAPPRPRSPPTTQRRQPRGSIGPPWTEPSWITPPETPPETPPRRGPYRPARRQRPNRTPSTNEPFVPLVRRAADSLLTPPTTRASAMRRPLAPCHAVPTRPPSRPSPDIPKALGPPVRRPQKTAKQLKQS
jgi:hypothetical protein